VRVRPVDVDNPDLVRLGLGANVIWVLVAPVRVDDGQRPLVCLLLKYRRNEMPLRIREWIACVE
jgi:hypothetical protein